VPPIHQQPFGWCVMWIFIVMLQSAVNHLHDDSDHGFLSLIHMSNTPRKSMERTKPMDTVRYQAKHRCME
jgi:hypothetical protein